MGDKLLMELLDAMAEKNILISALKADHEFVPVLLATAQRFSAQIAKLTPQ